MTFQKPMGEVYPRRRLSGSPKGFNRQVVVLNSNKAKAKREANETYRLFGIAHSTSFLYLPGVPRGKRA